jgi:hypothetical protein
MTWTPINLPNTNVILPIARRKSNMNQCWAILYLYEKPLVLVFKNKLKQS